MDVVKMLADLRAEREAIEEAILTLERLAQGQGRRRGRPPAWLSALRKQKGQPPIPVPAPKVRGAASKAPVGQ